MALGMMNQQGLTCRCRTGAPVAHSRIYLQGAGLRVAAPRTQRQQRRVTVMSAEGSQVGAAYAKALIEVAQDSNSLEDTHKDVDALMSLLKENPQLANFLYSPMTSTEQKRKMVENLAKEARLKKRTVNFVNLLIDNHRVDAVEDVFAAFEEEYCTLTDTQVAVLRSAVQMEQEQHFLIAKKLQELTGAKNIKLKPVIDENLIAGFVVEYGSSQIDMSLAGQLNQITNDLEGREAALA